MQWQTHRVRGSLFDNKKIFFGREKGAWRKIDKNVPPPPHSSVYSDPLPPLNSFSNIFQPPPKKKKQKNK